MVSRRAILAVSVVGLALAAPAARSAAGADAKEQRWEGTLKVNAATQLRLVFHVTEGAGGALKATMDSPDQGATEIPVDAVTRDKTRLVFDLPNLQAKFDGKLNAAGTEAQGEWSQGGAKLPLTLKVAADKPSGTRPAANEQLFEGKITVGPGVKLRVVLHVFKDKAGALTAKFDSPDQGAFGLSVDSVTVEKTKFAFEMKAIAGKYEGKPNAAGDEIEGTWTQAGAGMPLTLKKVDRASEPPRRPQTPKPPLPYESKEVTYANKAGGVTLAGTLTIPEGRGPFPAALMISGSGAQDRDETILGHKPFAVIADALTRRGIAVLRVDDRGVGGSTGKTSESTTDDFAGDALAGVAFLKSRPEIDGRSIGLIGHSEGGIIAPIAAGRSKDVAFIVLMAGTGLPGEEILYLQGRLIAQAMGADKEALARQRDLQSKMFQVLKTEADPKAAAAKLREVARSTAKSLTDKEKKELGKTDLEPLLEGQMKMVESPWFRYFLTYDPRPALAKVRCPVLALIGEKDLQVPPKENLVEIEKALHAGGNRRATVKEMPGLNHLFQTSRTGNVTEYNEIEETVAPSALKLMGDWILDHVRKRP